MNDYELQGFDRQVAEAAAALNQRPARGAYTEILLAYDGSADARAALERVAAVASDGSEVTVVTVIPYEAVGSKLDPIAPTDRDWQWRCLVEATAHLRGYGIEPFIEAAAGNPAPVICETANSLKADLVILGYGHGGRRRPSVRKNPVRAAVEKTVKCDTLVVRAEQSAHAPRVADAPEEERLTRLRRRVPSFGTSHASASSLSLARPEIAKHVYSLRALSWRAGRRSIALPGEAAPPGPNVPRTCPLIFGERK